MEAQTPTNQEGSAGQPTASSFHQLLAPFEYLRPGQEHRSSPLSVEGRLVVKRVLGRRLAFFDLQSLAPGEDAVLQLRLLLREWERLHPLPDQADQLSPPISEISAEENEEDTKAKEKERSFYWATKHLKPGDIVEAEGYPERTVAGTLSLTVTGIRVIKQWVDPSLAASGVSTRGKHFPPRRRSPDESKNPTYVSRKLAVIPEQAATEAPLCKFWWKGKCEKGHRCKYRHAFVSDEERERVEEHKRVKAEIRKKEHDPSDPFEDKLPRSARAKIFSAWIVKTFGPENLREGSGVVDIAGGKGYLSYHLQCTEHAIPTTLIEPRPARLNKKQKKQLKKKQQPAFKQISTWFTPSLWSGEEAGESDTQARFATSRSEQDSVVSGGNPTTPGEVERLEPSAARSILKHCSVAVGLHSDQATEPIVDFALAHNKAFAVVPCCVFPEMFPHRRTKDGRPVVVTDDFIQYLMEKDPRIRLGYLEMEGRNKVVYMTDHLP